MYVNPEDPTVFTFKNFHLHDGAPSEIEAKKEVQKMRKRASETVEVRGYFSAVVFSMILAAVANHSAISTNEESGS